MIRSRPATGYAALWPLVRLQKTRALACSALGIDAREMRVARGFAILVHRLVGGAVAHRMPPSGNRSDARRAAAAHLAEGCACCGTGDGAPVARSVDLYTALAVGVGDVVLWQRVETLDVVTRPGRRDWYVAPNGVRKTASTADAEIVAIGDLAAALAAHRAQFTDDEVRRFLVRLDEVEWETATAAQQEGAWSAALANFRQADVRDLVKTWSATVETHAIPAAQLVRDRLRESILPQITVDLAQTEVEAVRAVSDQAGLFVRDRLGVESEWLTNRGREIVSQGLQEGLGREAIGSQLRAELPQMWSKYGDSYSNTVASNAVVRSRSIAQVGSYEEAGIERLEVVAMLDERTCPVCEMMDGQVIEVASAREILNRAAAATTIDELREASPFMRVTSDPETGEHGISTTNGVTVQPTGHGPTLGGDRLASIAGVAAPPYHSRCRCTTVMA